MNDPREKVFSLDIEAAGPIRSRVLKWVRPALESVTGLAGLADIYRRIPPHLRGVDVMRHALADLEVRTVVDDADLSRIPAEGPAIVVANHPYGGIEGLLLADLLARRRSDYKILANFLLGRIPEIRDLFLLVDPFGTQSSVRRNLRGLRETLKWLEAGHLLGVFPAGEVAHFDVRERRVADPPWHPMIARIARQAKCTVVPLHISGRNSALFQTVGLVHPRLRTAILARQMTRLHGATIRITVGSPVPPSRIATFVDDAATIAHLRDRTEILAGRSEAASAPPMQPRRTPVEAVPLIAPVDPHELIDEIGALPDDRKLAEAEGNEVWVAAAPEIPSVVREIGRLRERSFRAVGEGTGRELDLDEFDPYYDHLFVWNRAKSEVVGAYRMGRSDVIVERAGVAGLYTSTLFGYRSKLFDALGPSLELGRSFIRPEYQKTYAGLLLLWKGIGQYIIRNPDYATLFGPVSISADYASTSQNLIVSFLKQNRFVHPLSRYVKPRTPFQAPRRDPIASKASRMRDLEDVSAFISELEVDRKGVPILLKQYMKLGGRLLGFNIDPEFSNVLDVLLVVDLRETDRRILARYMGREGAEAFRDHHANRSSAAG